MRKNNSRGQALIETVIAIKAMSLFFAGFLLLLLLTAGHFVGRHLLQQSLLCRFEGKPLSICEFEFRKFSKFVFAFQSVSLYEDKNGVKGDVHRRLWNFNDRIHLEISK